MARLVVKESSMTAAFEAAARDILMNTAARIAAGKETVDAAKEILAVKRKAIKSATRRIEERKTWNEAVTQSVQDSRAAWFAEYGE